STALTHARLAGLFSGRHLVKPVNLTRSLTDFVEETPREFHRLILGRSFEQRVAADDLFRLGERTVGDGDLAAGALVHANAVAPKCTPSVAISHPAFMPSSMSLPIDAISASVGGRSTGSCVKMLMKRMSILLHLKSPATILLNGGVANRR